MKTAEWRFLERGGQLFLEVTADRVCHNGDATGDTIAYQKLEAAQDPSVQILWISSHKLLASTDDINQRDIPPGASEEDEETWEEESTDESGDEYWEDIDEDDPDNKGVDVQMKDISNPPSNPPSAVPSSVSALVSSWEQNIQNFFFTRPSAPLCEAATVVDDLVAMQKLSHKIYNSDEFCRELDAMQSAGLSQVSKHWDIINIAPTANDLASYAETASTTSFHPPSRISVPPPVLTQGPKSKSVKQGAGKTAKAAVLGSNPESHHQGTAHAALIFLWNSSAIRLLEVEARDCSHLRLHPKPKTSYVLMSVNAAQNLAKVQNPSAEAKPPLKFNYLHPFDDLNMELIEYRPEVFDRCGQDIVGGVRFRAFPPEILALLNKNHQLTEVRGIRRRAHMQAWSYGSMTPGGSRVPTVHQGVTLDDMRAVFRHASDVDILVEAGATIYPPMKEELEELAQLSDVNRLGRTVLVALQLRQLYQRCACYNFAYMKYGVVVQTQANTVCSHDTRDFNGREEHGTVMPSHNEVMNNAVAKGKHPTSRGVDIQRGAHIREVHGGYNLRLRVA
ncbi:hypothetical protein B0H14DRAFT_2591669 [Mycena olivaceomarginata]|nr:hypothetical protein B0H14DRAFT_2591669 [Mycena olivaceomarginata]